MAGKATRRNGGSGASRYLSELLDEAARAGRPVILTSDHGHYPGPGARDPRRAVRRRRATATGTPGPGEISVRGPRVLAADGEVVAAWDERIRYAPRKAGYHGGAAPSEVVVPVLVFVPSGVASARAAGMCSAPVWHRSRRGGTPSCPAQSRPRPRIRPRKSCSG